MNPIITITGRLGKTPELAFISQGTARASFSLATSSSKKLPTGEWAEGPTSWWNCTAWNKLAEHLTDSDLTPGTELTVAGELTEQTYTKRDGTQGKSVELTARTIAVSITRGPVTVRSTRYNPSSTPEATQ